MTKRAVIVGASSGIGRELATLFSQKGWTVGLAARRLPLLEETARNLSGPAFMRRIDVSDPTTATVALEELISEMGGLDLLVISSGTGFLNPGLALENELETARVNVSGFIAVANVAFRHFQSQGRGHLVGISSIAALRGSGIAPAYNASKAFQANYLEGLRLKAIKSGSGVIVTDIRPGLVDTAMAKGEGLFWVAPPEKAARQIFQAIREKAKTAYVTKRWRLVAWLLRILPDWLLARM